MKTMITKLAIVTMVVLFGSALKSNAQVTPATPSASLLCSDGALDFGAPAPNTTWIVRYSETSTTTPSEGVTLTGNTVPAATVKTGYYYLISKGTAVGSCESEMQEIPVYKFLPITATLTAADYCIENLGATTFSGPTSTGDANVPNFAYQWYTVSGVTETAISGATNATYTPPATILPGTTTTYRLKVGYLIGTLKYCATTSADKAVTVTAKPTKPTVTISGATGQAGL